VNPGSTRARDLPFRAAQRFVPSDADAGSNGAIVHHSATIDGKARIDVIGHETSAVTTTKLTHLSIGPTQVPNQTFGTGIVDRDPFTIIEA
jgi:hypothetical protein